MESSKKLDPWVRGFFFYFTTFSEKIQNFS